MTNLRINGVQEVTRFIVMVSAAVLVGAGMVAADISAPQSPNLIVILTDDQGYEDLGCFGSRTIKTPRLDRMAAEGLRLTNFYAQPVCGVSSDNGPWVETTHGMKPDGKAFIPRDHSGSAAPLRGWKRSAGGQGQDVKPEGAPIGTLKNVRISDVVAEVTIEDRARAAAAGYKGLKVDESPGVTEKEMSKAGPIMITGIPGHCVENVVLEDVEGFSETDQ